MIYEHKKKRGGLSNDRKERTFWSEIKIMIKQGSKLTYKDIADPFYEKLKFRASKDRMEKKSVYFGEDKFAYFEKW
jgi:hypothetical protein